MHKKNKKIKFINHGCLPIFMLLYIILHIMLAYIMWFAALSNAVCLLLIIIIIMVIFKCYFSGELIALS